MKGDNKDIPSNGISILSGNKCGTFGNDRDIVRGYLINGFISIESGMSCLFLSRISTIILSTAPSNWR